MLEDNWTTEREHCKNPQSGDYWTEMFAPLMLVVDVLENGYVLVCEDIVSADKNHWRWDVLQLKVIHKDKMRERFRYKSREGFWARCSPNCMLSYVTYIKNNEVLKEEHEK